MDHEIDKTRPRKMMNRREAATKCATSLRLTGSVVIMIMLLWTIRTGFELATEPGDSYDGWAFHVGILTVVFGFLFLVLGFVIVADSFLNLSDQLQEDTAVRPATKDAKKEPKSSCKAVARLFMTLITMSLLLWAIRTGFRLATEPRRDSGHYLLTFSVGLVTIIFGLIYFIIGLAIVAELALELSGRPRRKEKEDWHSSKL